jgi:hypothetical protein
MNFENVMINALAHTGAAAFNSGPVNFGYAGLLSGVVMIENGLDQNVTVQLQARPREGATWQNVETSSVVAAGGTGNIATTTPWPEVRITCTPAGAVASGTFSAWWCGV